MRVRKKVRFRVPVRVYVGVGNMFMARGRLRVLLRDLQFYLIKIKIITVGLKIKVGNFKVCYSSPEFY